MHHGQRLPHSKGLDRQTQTLIVIFCISQIEILSLVDWKYDMCIEHFGTKDPKL